MTDVTDAAEVFARDAPWLSEQLLREQVLDFCGADALDPAAVWVFGSFADPDTEIDREDSVSDLDVFVVIDGWDLPVAEPALAEQAGEGHGRGSVLLVVGAVEWAGDRDWGCSAREAWEQLPENAQAVLREVTRQEVIATEADETRNRGRPLDLFLGSREAFERWTEPGARFRLWPEGDDG